LALLCDEQRAGGHGHVHVQQSDHKAESYAHGTGLCAHVCGLEESCERVGMSAVLKRAAGTEEED
jgi:hypothetical protein